MFYFDYIKVQIVAVWKINKTIISFETLTSFILLNEVVEDQI